MISKSSSTNPENFTLIGDTSCKCGRYPMEIPLYHAMKFKHAERTRIYRQNFTGQAKQDYD